MNEQKPKQKVLTSVRRKNIRGKQSEAIKAIAGDLSGKSALSLVEAYKNSNNVLHSKVMAKVNELESKIGQFKQGDIQSAAFRKMHVKNLREFYAELGRLGIDVTGIDRTKIEELVALDDWGTISSIAMPLIKQYGPSVLQALYKKFLKPSYDKWMGGDEGLNPADWGHVLGPSRFTAVNGENVELPGVKSVLTQQASFNTVDPKSIASTLCTELYKHRYAYTETMKTALANLNGEYSITTNASGQVGVLFAPLLATHDGSNLSNSYITIYNDSTFSVTTGGQTVATTAFRAGPLSGSSGSISMVRVTNAAIQIIPTASFNTAGAFTLGYQNRWGNFETNLSIGTTLAQLKNFPYVTSFNNKVTARMVNVTGDQGDENFASTAAYGTSNQAFILLGSGLPASTEVCRIVISSVAEFIPKNDALPICIMDFPRPGPLTEQFESMMFTRYPVLQQLDLIDAKRIADSFPDLPVEFDWFMSHLGYAISGVKPREYVTHIASADIALPNQSMEFLIE